MPDREVNWMRRAIIASVVSGILLMGLSGYFGMRVAIAQMEGQFAALHERISGAVVRIDGEIVNLKKADERHEADIRQLRGPVQ